MFKHVLALAATVAVAAVIAIGAAGAAETATLPNPLRTAHPGQWVQYRINTLFGIAEQKQTLIRVEGEGSDRVFTIKSEMSVDDELVDERTDAITYEQALAEQESALEDATDVHITNTVIAFKNLKIDCVLVKFLQEGKECRLYLSEEVPLVGMLRMEIDGMDEPAMQLVDFGQN